MLKLDKTDAQTLLNTFHTEFTHFQLLSTHTQDDSKRQLDEHAMADFLAALKAVSEGVETITAAGDAAPQSVAYGKDKSTDTQAFGYEPGKPVNAIACLIGLLSKSDAAGDQPYMLKRLQAVEKFYKGYPLVGDLKRLGNRPPSPTTLYVEATGTPPKEALKFYTPVPPYAPVDPKAIQTLTTEDLKQEGFDTSKAILPQIGLGGSPLLGLLGKKDTKAGKNKILELISRKGAAGYKPENYERLQMAFSHLAKSLEEHGLDPFYVRKYSHAQQAQVDATSTPAASSTQTDAATASSTAASTTSSSATTQGVKDINHYASNRGKKRQIAGILANGKVTPDTPAVDGEDDADDQVEDTAANTQQPASAAASSTTTSSATTTSAADTAATTSSTLTSASTQQQTTTQSGGKAPASTQQDANANGQGATSSPAPAVSVISFARFKELHEMSVNSGIFAFAKRWASHMKNKIFGTKEFEAKTPEDKMKAVEGHANAKGNSETRTAQILKIMQKVEGMTWDQFKTAYDTQWKAEKVHNPFATKIREMTTKDDKKWTSGDLWKKAVTEHAVQNLSSRTAKVLLAPTPKPGK